MQIYYNRTVLICSSQVMHYYLRVSISNILMFCKLFVLGRSRRGIIVSYIVFYIVKHLIPNASSLLCLHDGADTCLRLPAMHIEVSFSQ